jgi:uncharacterized DUF497 family protein
MKITKLIFLEKIVDKLARKHNVSEFEVREIFNNSPKFRFIEKGHRQNESVYASYGQTYSGRYLVVFFIYKNTKDCLIISARDMTYAERRKYQQK